jgi:1,4-alpha-glucan branching enzyme
MVPSQRSKGIFSSIWKAPISRPPALTSPTATAGSSSPAEAPGPQAIIALDAQLAPHEGHLNYRWSQYQRTLNNIIEYEGSLENFALGHEKFGIIRENGRTIYREWAPGAEAAQLIGDFNGWAGTWMTKDDFGVWSVELPDDPNGAPAIAHGSRVKIRLQHPGGWWVDRLPAWIKWATVPEGVMGAKFDGIHWDPPAAEKYSFKHSRPEKASSLRIYEAHVGMSSEAEGVASYTYFKENVLPRIKKLGYNAIQLMAIQEHAYYGSFGYHVTNPFAVSSRSGTPEELKALVDEAHRLGLVVLLDVVHSHISSNADDGIAGFDFGQGRGSNYFLQGDAGYHRQWDSKLLDYSCYEVLRYLLSNIRYWMDEYQFDGFRFDGVTSMLYHHHGIDVGFSGNYAEYCSPSTNVDAVVYLMLANKLIHNLHQGAVTVAEDVSGMPALGRPVEECGGGFDYRLGMGIPDFWIKLLKHTRDEDWKPSHLVSVLCNRRYTEKTVAYAESHDQALVGDQTIAFRLMGAEMYSGMSALQPASPLIDRGMSLHKVIRAVTMALGGEAYLNFMGNEFGHPEWMDFPREGNDWSYKYCRRQWSLVDSEHLRYPQLNAFDAACMAADDKFEYISSGLQWVTVMDDERQVLVAERGPLLFVFNLSPFDDYEGLAVPAPVPGKYRAVLDSDGEEFGGKGRIGHTVDHFTQPGSPEDPAAQFHERGQHLKVLAPSRTVVAYALVNEEEEKKTKAKTTAASKKTTAGAAAKAAPKAAKKKST